VSKDKKKKDGKKDKKKNGGLVSPRPQRA